MYEYTPYDDLLVTDGYRQHIMDSVYKNDLEELEKLSEAYYQCILYYSIQYRNNDIFDKFYNSDSHHNSFLSLAIEYKNEYAVDIILKCCIDYNRYSENSIKNILYSMEYNIENATKLIDYIVNVLNSTLNNLYANGYHYSHCVYKIQTRILKQNCLNEITQRHVYKCLCRPIEYEIAGTNGPSIFSFLYAHNKERK